MTIVNKQDAIPEAVKLFERILGRTDNYWWAEDLQMNSDYEIELKIRDLFDIQNWLDDYRGFK